MYHILTQSDPTVGYQVLETKPKCKLTSPGGVSGKNPFSVDLSQRILLRPPSEGLVGPVPKQVRLDSPYFTSLFSTSATERVPNLKVHSSRVRHTADTVDFLRKKSMGEILINPMMTSTLTVQDQVTLLGGTSGTGSVAIGFHGLPRPPAASHCFPSLNFVEGYNPGEIVPESSAPSPTLSANSAYFRAVYRTTNDPSRIGSVFERFGLTERVISAWHKNILGELIALERDKAMTTSVIADTRSGTYDLLTDLAESRESVATIMSCVIRIIKGFLQTHTLVSSLPKQDVQAIAGHWLEYRYGIMPIVYSANAAIEYLRIKQFEYAKFRGITSRKLDIRLSANVTASLPVIVDRAFGKVRIKSHTGGLKLNPLSTGLELVPLSLLLNWVSNLGDVLSALWPPSGVDQEVYSYSRSVPKSIINIVIDGVPLQAEFGFYRLDSINPYDNITLELQWNMTWKRWIDAFALAYGPLKAAVKVASRQYHQPLVRRLK